jgi:adenylosuccinate lyase
VVFPDVYHVLVYSLRLLSEILEGLTVREDMLKRNFHLTRGLIFSQRVLSRLILRGYEREEAYELVKRAADRVWREGVDFRSALKGEGVEVEDDFSLDWLKRRVDEIFSQLPWEGDE